MKENEPIPPRLAQQLLLKFLRKDLAEDVSGDLDEKFYDDIRIKSVFRARLSYWYEVLNYMRPFAIRRSTSLSFRINRSAMILRANLKFVLRLFLKDKFFSTLNILGLALGIAVSIILLLTLQYDLGYDKHYANYDRIYRFGAHIEASGSDTRIARSSREFEEMIGEELPEVEAVTRFNVWGRRGSTLVKGEVNGQEVSFYEPAIVYADTAYFSVFKTEFVAGSESSFKNTPAAMVITESTARRYFGNDNPIGKTLNLPDFWNGTICPVVGVIKDIPDNTHVKFNILLSMFPRAQPLPDSIPSQRYWNTQFYVYAKMHEHYDPQSFFTKWSDLDNKYFKSAGSKNSATYTPIMQRLDEIHFHSDLEMDEPVGKIAYLYAFAGIGFFIILLASINYMNLATAKSAKRASEIAMKKALGSGKASLAMSFLCESLLLSLISLLLAFVIVAIVLNQSSFNDLIGRNLVFDLFNSPQLLIGSAAIALGIGVLSGLHPALYLPQIPTIEGLKGAFRSSKSSHLLRRALIVTQFSISIFVVVCTLFISDQMNFLRNTDMGFNKDNVLVIATTDDVRVQQAVPGIKNELLQNAHIKGITNTMNVLGWPITIWNPVLLAESDHGMIEQSFSSMEVDEDYFKTLGIELVKGRNFEPGRTDMNVSVICNETAARQMGWGDDPVGKKVIAGESETTVIGMVKDFNSISLHNAIAPMIIFKNNATNGFVHISVDNQNLPETMEFIKTTWTKHDPNHPFSYFFLDERFDTQYKSDEAQAKLVSILSYICIFISALGLIGLSAFNAVQRTKEIGIRKIFGATVPRIIYLLYRDVLLMVIGATVLVVMPTYYFVGQWLSNFAYQITPNYLSFVLVMAVAMLFAFCIVAIQSIRTARANPVKSLRHE